MNGYEMTIQIKQDTDLGHLPVILLTTKMLEEERLEALTAGADDLISKPFRLRELQLRIDNIIANRHRIHSEQFEKKEETIEHITPQHQLTADQEYVRRAIKCINDHITDTEYSREDFAADMGNSVSTLYNKIRSLTGKSVTNFSREIRIKTACRLAKENPDLRVSDIAYQVGYKDPKYFATSFKRVMGIQPKEYFLKLRDEK
jgi:AraC-like DNA-binding protein